VHGAASANSPHERSEMRVLEQTPDVALLIRATLAQSNLNFFGGFQKAGNESIKYTLQP
jgi:hypothetical protein